MNKTNATYGQLEKVLRGLGFTCSPGKRTPSGLIYEHQATGALVALPAFPKTDKVYEHHVGRAD